MVGANPQVGNKGIGKFLDGVRGQGGIISRTDQCSKQHRFYGRWTVHALDFRKRSNPEKKRL